MAKASVVRNAAPPESPYSFKNVVGFVNDNFGILLIVLVTFFTGFFMGSLWTENQMRKNGNLGSGGTAQPVAETGSNRTPLTKESFISIAEDLGVKKADFEKCFDSNKYEAKITESADQGLAAGVKGTPGTIVVVNGKPKEIISGAAQYAALKTTVDKYLADPNAEPTTTNGLVPDSFVAVSNTDHLRGNRNASVVLVEYSDYECPFCYSFHPNISQIAQEYSDKIGWVYRHYPLVNIHPSAMPSAIAAECVAELKGEDAFWKFSDKLFE